MPILLESRVEIDRTRFDRKVVIVEPPEIKKLISSPPAAAAEGAGAPTCTTSSSSSSSIGKNSESCGSDGEGFAGEEVESAYKGPLNALESLEKSLPIRRGISNFYHGKSKSFASLSDITVACPLIKDFAKQENGYTRKRRNLVASKNFLCKSSSGPSRNNGGGISKKSPSNGRSMLALAAAMNNINNIMPGDRELTANYGSPQCCSFPVRSFSLADLRGTADKF